MLTLFRSYEIKSAGAALRMMGHKGVRIRSRGAGLWSDPGAGRPIGFELRYAARTDCKVDAISLKFVAGPVVVGANTSISRSSSMASALSQIQEDRAFQERIRARLKRPLANRVRDMLGALVWAAKSCDSGDSVHGLQWYAGQYRASKGVPTDPRLAQGPDQQQQFANWVAANCDPNETVAQVKKSLAAGITPIFVSFPRNLVPGLPIDDRAKRVLLAQPDGVRACPFTLQFTDRSDFPGTLVSVTAPGTPVTASYLKGEGVEEHVYPID